MWSTYLSLFFSFMSYQNSWHSSRIISKNLKSVKFLDTMEKIVPRKELVEKIEEVRKESGWAWRPTIPTMKLLKMYFLQQRFNLSDPGVEEAIYDRTSFQKFIDVDIVTDQIPDETTLCRFRKLLNDNDLQKELFATINLKLESKWLILNTWTIMDATIIQAPSSTKNKDEIRDPEMHSTKKWNQRYFGMKTHIWVDTEHGLVQKIVSTPANIYDWDMASELQHWNEKIIYWDSAYHSKEKENEAKLAWKLFFVCKKASRNRALTDLERIHNRFFSWTRAKVEHIFWIIKNLWWHRKVHYKWIHKNELQWYMLCWLANLYKVRSYL